MQHGPSYLTRYTDACNRVLKSRDSAYRYELEKHAENRNSKRYVSWLVDLDTGELVALFEVEFDMRKHSTCIMRNLITQQHTCGTNKDMLREYVTITKGILDHENA